MTKTPNPHFTPGKMVWYRRDNNSPWKQVQVWKVHKNGNFTTYETMRQQWRCSPTGDHASETGASDSFSTRFASIIACTPENDEQVARENGPLLLWKRWQAASGKIDQFSRRQPAMGGKLECTEEMVAALEAVAALIPKRDRI